MIISIPNSQKIKAVANFIQLDDIEGDAQIIVSKDLYDQCLLLSAKFDNNIAPVKSAAKSCETTRCEDLPGFVEFVGKVKNGLPHPINMLLPMLYVFGGVPGMSFEGLERADFYMLMNQLTLSMDFYAFVTSPHEYRSKFTMNRTLLMNRQITYNSMLEMFKDDAPVYANAAVDTHVGIHATNSTEVVDALAENLKQQTVEEKGEASNVIKAEEGELPDLSNIQPGETVMVEMDWGAILSDIEDKQQKESTNKSEEPKEDKKGDSEDTDGIVNKLKYGLTEMSADDKDKTQQVLNRFKM